MRDRDGFGEVRATPRARRLLPAVATAFAVAVLAASQVTNLWGFREQERGRRPDLVFAGTLPQYLDDAAADWAFMREAKDGHFFLSDRYTVDEHPRNYVNVLMWALGTVARWLGADVVRVYFAAKFVFGALLLFLLYRLARRLFERPGQVFACYLLLVLAGGWEGPIAWLQRNLHFTGSASSPGWWMPEISTSVSMMLFPHLTAGFSAMIAVSLLMLTAWEASAGGERRGRTAAAGAGAVLFVLTLFHPFDSVTVLATLWTAPLLLGVAARRWPLREARASLIATVVAAPAIAYDLYLVATNPAIRAWHLQGVMASLEPRQLVMGLGVNALLALLLLPRLRALRPPQLLMLAWLLSAIVLSYVPFHFQRRMLGGIQIPLAAIAASTIVFVLVPPIVRVVSGGRPESRWTRFQGAIAVAIVLLLAPLNVLTPYYVHKQQLREIAHHNYPAWLSVEEARALRELEKVAPQGAKTLASYESGNFIPSYSGRTTFLGHNAMTIDSKSRHADVARFYSAGPEDDAWRQELLQRFGIDYVLYTPRERALGSFDPSTREWLQEVFVTGEDPERRAAIYRRR